MEKTLSAGVKRGFPEQWLKRHKEPKIKNDERGYYIYTVNENKKIYVEDFYYFLEKTERRCLDELKNLEEKIGNCARN